MGFEKERGHVEYTIEILPTEDSLLYVYKCPNCKPHICKTANGSSTWTREGRPFDYTHSDILPTCKIMQKVNTEAEGYKNPCRTWPSSRLLHALPIYSNLYCDWLWCWSVSFLLASYKSLINGVNDVRCALGTLYRLAERNSYILRRRGEWIYLNWDVDHDYSSSYFHYTYILNQSSSFSHDCGCNISG
jgi:hypothetical protein